MLVSSLYQALAVAARLSVPGNRSVPGGMDLEIRGPSTLSLCELLLSSICVVVCAMKVVSSLEDIETKERRFFFRSLVRWQQLDRPRTVPCEIRHRGGHSAMRLLGGRLFALRLQWVRLFAMRLQWGRLFAMRLLGGGGRLSFTSLVRTVIPLRGSAA
jgi:hypothetical protein